MDLVIAQLSLLRRTPAVLLLFVGVFGVTLGAFRLGIAAPEQPTADDGGPVVLGDGEPPNQRVSGTEDLELTADRQDWDRLADCESGEWDRDGEPQPDTARWDYGIDFDHGDHFQGGLNFHPETWDNYREEEMPGHAGLATPREEIVIGERVLEEQGWEAWPTCSELVGLAS